MSISYEVYKKSVGEKTMSGEDMKLFDEMPEAQKKGWQSVDAHYSKKQLPNECEIYDDFKKKSKNLKEFKELPNALKKSWVNIENNFEKLVNKADKAEKAEKKKEERQKSKPKPKAKKDTMKTIILV